MDSPLNRAHFLDTSLFESVHYCSRELPPLENAPDRLGVLPISRNITYQGVVETLRMESTALAVDEDQAGGRIAKRSGRDPRTHATYLSRDFNVPFEKLIS